VLAGGILKFDKISIWLDFQFEYIDSKNNVVQEVPEGFQRMKKFSVVMAVFQ
jgi:DNA sulfur modification protein DndD